MQFNGKQGSIHLADADALPGVTVRSAWEWILET